MMIAVLFVLCCGVSGTVGSIFCSPRSDVGSSFSCCGLPVYPAYGHFVNRVRRMAVGWVDFWWPVCHQFQHCFFVLEFTSLFTPNFIPATACFSLLLYPTMLLVLMIILAGISHAPRQTARLSLTLASSTTSWCLYMPLARSGRLIESSISTRNSFWASFARLPWPRTLLWTFTYVPRMQQAKALIDWLIHRWIYQNRDKTLLFSLHTCIPWLEKVGAWWKSPAAMPWDIQILIALRWCPVVG